MRWPSLSLFKQQRLPAWQPLLSPRYVAMWLIALAAVLVPIGIVLTVANSTAADYTFRYDHISQCTSASNQGAFEYTGNGETLRRGCVTKVAFTLPRRLRAPVYLYYGLTRFYQNHRRFAHSISNAQLAGHLMGPRALIDTSPLGHPGELQGHSHAGLTIDGALYHYGDCVYVPAGLIPWAMFNDTFTLYRVDGNAGDPPGLRRLVCDSKAFSRSTNEPLARGPHVGGAGCRKKGIAWSTDVEYKYKPPALTAAQHPTWSAPWVEAYGHATAPVTNDSYFSKGWYAGELGHDIPVVTDEDLMVWARAASLPTFRKLFRVITEDLEPGEYLMYIGEHYDVSTFGGEKSFTLATLSWLGGRNTFLARLYTWTGVVAALGAVLFVYVHNYYGDRAQQALAELLRS